MIKYLIVFSFSSLWLCNESKGQFNNLDKQLKSSLNLATEQYKNLYSKLPDSLFPRNISKDGRLVTNLSTWWTSGFFPASLWYLYEYNQDRDLLGKAIHKSKMVEKEKWNISDHDIGFKIYCPFGNGLRITGDTTYIHTIINAAGSLSKRFDPEVGLIRSWGNINDKKEFIVIIDNMMNLELMFAATKLSGDSTFYKIAIAQADKTMQQHFRVDGSSFHLVIYDPSTGNVKQKKTAQGYADGSAWARGQAWGLYGYTVCYRETKDTRYLEQAKKIASFILEHPRLPSDGIPYWDYDVPESGFIQRDASAAAIMASAFIELSAYTSKKERKKLLAKAALILSTLSSPHYRTVAGEAHNFLLKHSVGHLPAGSEVDTPLSYADYYYIEAMLRWLKKGKARFK